MIWKKSWAFGLQNQKPLIRFHGGVVPDAYA